MVPVGKGLKRLLEDGSPSSRYPVALGVMFAHGSLPLACKLHEAEECFWMNNFYKLAERVDFLSGIFNRMTHQVTEANYIEGLFQNSKFLPVQRMLCCWYIFYKGLAQIPVRRKSTQFYGLACQQTPAVKSLQPCLVSRIMDITWTLCPCGIYTALVPKSTCCFRKQGRKVLVVPEHIYTAFLGSHLSGSPPQRRSWVLCVFHIEI